MVFLVKKRIILLIILLFSFNSKVYALSASVSIDCGNKVKQGDKLLCDVNMSNVSGIVYGIKFNYEIDDGISYDSFDSSDNNYIIKDKDGFNIVYVDGIKEDYKIGTLSLKVSDNVKSDSVYSISLSNIDIADTDSDYLTVASTAIKIAGNNVETNPKAGVKNGIIGVLIILSLGIIFIYYKRSGKEI